MSIDATFLVVGSAHSERVAQSARALARYAQVSVVKTLGVLPKECIGVVVTDHGRSSPTGHLAAAGSLISVPGHKRLTTQKDVEAFASYSVARWCCGNDPISEVISTLMLTPKQVPLVALLCTQMQRRPLAEVLGVSHNTLKTRIRLLPKYLGKSGVDALVDDVLGHAGVPALVPVPEHVPGSSARPPPASSRALEDVPSAWLNLPLCRLRLSAPARTLCRQAGVSTLGELLLHRGLRRTRGINSWLGSALQELETLGPTPGLTGCRDWQDALACLTPELRAAPIADLPVLNRLHVFARRYDLLSLDEVLSHPSLIWGKRTFEHTRGVLTNLLKRPVEVLRGCDLSGKRSVAEALRRRLAVLKSVHCDVIERRSGLRGKVESLLAIGKRYGKSRERIRQLEAEAIIRLSTHGFAAAVEARVREIWCGGVLALDDASATWLQGDSKHADVLPYALKHFVSASARPHLVEVHGHTYLMPVSQIGYEEKWKGAAKRLLKLSYPASRADVLDAVTDNGRLAAFVSPFMRSASQVLLWSPKEEMALAFGVGHKQCVLAVLRAADAPIPIAQLIEHVGRGEIPDEVIYFKRGVVGLEQHFPDFAMYKRFLTSSCVRKVRSAPERQWNAQALFVEAKRDHGAKVPSWMTYWHLTALLRRAPALRYLGRHHFVLATHQASVRRTCKDMLAQILRARREPMTLKELVAAIRECQDTSPDAVRAALLSNREFVAHGTRGWTLARPASDKSAARGVAPKDPASTRKVS